MDQEQVKRSILDAAYEVLAERGYQEASVALIAEKAGVKPVIVRKHFKDKRALFYQIIDDVMGAFDRALADESPTASETVEEYVGQVIRMGQKMYDFYLSHPYTPKILFYETLGIDEEVAARIRASFDVLAMYTTSFLMHGINRGFVRDDVLVRETAVLVNTMIFEIARQITREKKRDQMYQRWMEAVISLLTGGLLAPDARGTTA